ncbi:hypothetical protein Tcan_13349 [Toxocara canis]|uniref:SH2 domain-containing protein n=1 Tax=Toxocara canis TaxID=6265 RepID=A0A0B2VGN9_TOXCA|nr:hypothetical protein Tcan_13349 [Toxocara canis]
MTPRYGFGVAFIVFVIDQTALVRSVRAKCLADLSKGTFIVRLIEDASCILTEFRLLRKPTR